MISTGTGKTDYPSLIPGWLAATEGSRLRVSVEDLDRQVAELRLRLRAGAPTGLMGSDDDIAILSRLSGMLLDSPDPPELVLSEAAGAFDLVAALSWPADEFGERAELLCYFAFSAWRSARRLGDPAESHKWMTCFDRVLAETSTFRQCVEYLLAALLSLRSDELAKVFLCDSGNMFAVCAVLRQTREASPQMAAEQAAFVYEFVRREWQGANSELERAFFLGETALIASGSHRLLGHRTEAISWLGLATNAFLRIPRAEDAIARVLYAYVAIQYESGDCDFVLGELPVLIRKFESVGADREVAKCWIVECATLKMAGRIGEALASIEKHLDSDIFRREADLLASALLFAGELKATRGQTEAACGLYVQTAAVLSRTNAPRIAAELKTAVGETYRDQGYFGEALRCFSEALDEFNGLGMEAFAARVRIEIAESLLATGREKDAGEQLLLALPIIESQKMMPEGLAAAELLRESVSRRKTDPKALRELRDQLRRRV